MKTEVLSTGDKILALMQESGFCIGTLAREAGVREDTLLNIVAGITDGDIRSLVRIADALEVHVEDLCPDEDRYPVNVDKDTLAKLLVICEIDGVELEDLISEILEKGIPDYEFPTSRKNPTRK